jgi:hypothetical protein
VEVHSMGASLFDRARGLFRSAEPAPKSAPKSAPTRKAATAHHAVEIVAGRHACAAALALRDERFLSREAPALPLASCGSTACECRYEHFDDRRKRGRRARDLCVAIDGYEGEEHRGSSRPGRRKSDGK